MRRKAQGPQARLSRTIEHYSIGAFLFYLRGKLSLLFLHYVANTSLTVYFTQFALSKPLQVCEI